MIVHRCKSETSERARIQRPQTQSSAAPLLRWAGGKRRLVPKLLAYLPPDLPRRSFVEPFLGGGSLFFALRPRRAILADANPHLMKCYEYVRRSPDLIHAYLRKHARSTCERHYYEVRRTYNASPFSAAQAARFIYLNATCFNGIFRVNKEGHFNVPYGRKEPPKIPGLALLRAASEALDTADLLTASFEDSLSKAPAGSFVFLDPPYPPLNGTSYFTHYTADRFAETNQCLLADVVSGLDASGAAVMMTNADTPLIRRLYRHFNTVKLLVTRSITCKSRKHTVSELVITNYQV